MRAAAVIFVACAVLGCAAPASAEDVVFTVGGGGTGGPVEGMLAAQSWLEPTAVTVEADGTVVFLESGQPWAVDADGLLHRLPALVARAEDIDAEPDGSLLAVSTGQLFRLPAGMTTWQLVFTPPPAHAPALNAAQAERVSHMSGGRVLVGGTYLSWVLDHDGGTIETLHRGGGEGVAELDGGGLALLTGYDGLAIRSAGGRFRGRFEDGVSGDILALPGGDVLLATGDRLLRVDQRLRVQPYVSVTPGPGIGDGGALSRALIAPVALAGLPSGGFVFVDRTAPFLRGRFAAWASVRRGRWIADLDRAETNPESGLLRLATRRLPRRSAVALTRATFSSLARGRVSYRSSIAGQARLWIQRGDAMLDYVTFPVERGRGSVPLPARPPRGDLRVTMQVQNGASTATARLAVSTRRRLDFARARRLIREQAERSGVGDPGGGVESELGRCAIRGTRRLDCGLVLTDFDEHGTVGKPYCGGVFSARQRVDGMRIALLRARRGSGCLEPAAAATRPS
ncbi:hypothetical protein [Solirubrobacter soli]|uniref:hypothetical protein n=1 Tax=Solirubrobacter soli TaxID=363832 RepID=UPI000408FF1C|nr:hypothetical protein [Solirubrobacter soli]